ncbi:MAG: DUF5060 domain-containing protein [Phycisphaerae bacterium]|nr:DUF5060 domain-containing protein [Phycisphaerae bacterium]
MNARVNRICVWLCVFAAACMPASGKDLGQREARMWRTLEWDAEAPDYSGNPFDVVAKVTFTHKDTGEKRTTQMFYDAEKTWKFRFVGTRAGKWQFTSESKVGGLAELTGGIQVTENRDPKIKGFVTNVGNKFAVQVKNASDLRAYIFNVYMGRVKHPAYLDEFGPDLHDARKKAQAYLEDATANGFEIIFIHVNNNWFKHGVRKHSEHKSENPDPVAFAVLEQIITTVHNLGGRVHIWAWGDESRKWTPRGLPGGTNGRADRRLQRYIAARLGPMPGWTMGYGFDLHEWTNTEQLNSWAECLHEHFAWQHLLCARGHVLKGPHNINSYDGFGRNVPLKTTSHGPADYAEIIEDLNGDKARPHFYEERHSFKRSGFDLDMDGTRRLLWRESMAGGMGGFFGFYPDSPHPYPKSGQLRTHYDFWHKNDRFALDMQPANDLIEGGYALRSPSKGLCIFYKEDTSILRMDLRAFPGEQRAVAVDTKGPLGEFTIGVFGRTENVWTWKAPDRSDWVVLVDNCYTENRK